MLDQICAEIRNYFIRNQQDIHRGTFTIADHSIGTLPFLQEGQYYRIRGSVFNDGVHVYAGSEELTDEMFTGEIWAMAVPKAIIDLDAEIQAWVDANAEALASPYQSESFGGYSYTKSSGNSGTGASGGSYGWQNQFATRLNPYRRISLL